MPNKKKHTQCKHTPYLEGLSVQRAVLAIIKAFLEDILCAFCLYMNHRAVAQTQTCISSLSHWWFPTFNDNGNVDPRCEAANASDTKPKAFSRTAFEGSVRVLCVDGIKTGRHTHTHTDAQQNTSIEFMVIWWYAHSLFYSHRIIYTYIFEHNLSDRRGFLNFPFAPFAWKFFRAGELLRFCKYKIT